MPAPFLKSDDIVHIKAYNNSVSAISNQVIDNALLPSGLMLTVLCMFKSISLMVEHLILHELLCWQFSWMPMVSATFIVSIFPRTKTTMHAYYCQISTNLLVVKYCCSSRHKFLCIMFDSKSSISKLT